MQQNKYDQKSFFQKYATMERSLKGLEGAGEWHILQKMLPSFKNKRVLDLGCGFGWHCQYAIDHGAKKVVGVDISKQMLAKAKAISSKKIIYQQKALEKVDFLPRSFDIVLSVLTFHYIKSWNKLVKKMWNFLDKDGILIFSVEHPVFTANQNQKWCDQPKNKINHWPVDNYFIEGLRNTIFLDEKVIKYHRTLTTYLQTLIKQKFAIIDIVEPTPSLQLLAESEEMKHELRRPMMLIIKAKKIE